MDYSAIMQKQNFSGKRAHFDQLVTFTSKGQNDYQKSVDLVLLRCQEHAGKTFAQQLTGRCRTLDFDLRTKHVPVTSRWPRSRCRDVLDPYRRMEQRAGFRFLSGRTNSREEATVLFIKGGV
jgi:hypothetical protein